MKSNFKRKMFYTEAEIDKYIQDEWNKREQAVFNSCKQDITAQLMATCCMVLHTESTFAFGRTKLNRFKDGVESLFKVMGSAGLNGKEATTQNCIDLMRDKFGIDFDKKPIDKD